MKYVVGAVVLLIGIYLLTCTYFAALDPDSTFWMRAIFGIPAILFCVGGLEILRPKSDLWNE